MPEGRRVEGGGGTIQRRFYAFIVPKESTDKLSFVFFRGSWSTAIKAISAAKEILESRIQAGDLESIAMVHAIDSGRAYEGLNGKTLCLTIKHNPLHDEHSAESEKWIEEWSKDFDTKSRSHRKKEVQ